MSRNFAQSPALTYANRGAGADVITAVTAGSYTDSAAAPADMTLTVTSTGGWSFDGTNLGNLLSGSWINNTANAGNYSVRWTNTSGTLSAGTAGSWLALTSSRAFTVSRGSLAGTKTCTGTVDFALTSNTSSILATSSVTIVAENVGGGGPNP